MAVTWGTLKAQIARKLGDPTYSKYSEDLLKDAANDALVAFASAHTGVASDFPITGDGSTYEYSLPSDIVDDEDSGVYAVHWEEQTWLKRLEYWAGMAWPSTARSTSSHPLGYVLWPQGKISFARTPSDGQEVTVHYVAYYPEIATDNTEITVPRWAREAIKLYAVARALDPKSVTASDLGQWKTRRDAGGPEDNPLVRQAEYFMKQYYELLAAHPAPQYMKLQPTGKY